jgi:hypothetical protein
MKTADKFGTFDVADSMAAAAARLNVPLEVVKQAKREGCTAFKGSRVHLRELAGAIASPVEQPSTAEVLLIMVKQIVRRIKAVESLPLNAARKREIGNLTEAIHNGFGLALSILELDNVDQFLKRSAALFEQICGGNSTR